MRFMALLRTGFFVSLLAFGFNVVVAQTPTIATRGSDGKLHVRRQGNGAYLGAYLGDVGRNHGARIGKVLDDSPAARAGLQESDILLGFESQQIENAAHVYQLLTNTQPNQTVSLRLRRGAEEKTLKVQLGERTPRSDDPCQKLFSETNALFTEAERFKALAEEAARKGDQKLADEKTKEADAFFKQAEISRVDIEKAIAEGRTGIVGRTDACLPKMPQSDVPLGLEITPLTAQLANYFGVTSGGVLITEIKLGSLAAQAGLNVGDCLVRLNGIPVTNANELKLAFDASAQDVAAHQTLSFAIIRASQLLTLQVTKK